MPSYSPGSRLDQVLVTRWERTPDGFVLAFSCSDSEEFQLALNVIKSLPAYARKWNITQKYWWISYTAAPSLMALFPPLREYLSDQEYYRNRQYEQQNNQKRRRRTSRTSPASLPDPVSEAFRTLCLTSDAPIELLTAAKRTWSKLLHPDHAGGDELRMARVNNALDVIQDWRKQQQAHNKRGA